MSSVVKPWSDFYNKLEHDGMVPSPSVQTIDRSQAVFQSMFLDLGGVKSKLTAAGVTPLTVNIYADVLHIPDRLTWSLVGSALVIMARRVEIGDGSKISLDYRNSPQSAKLLFFADEVAGNLTVAAATPSGAQSFSISTPPPQGGVQVSFQGGAAVLSQITRAQGTPMALPAGFKNAITTELVCASLLYDQEPLLALGMLRWLKEWSGESPELRGTFLRSSSLLALLGAEVDAAQNGAAFVPYLTQHVYTDLASAFVREAQQYERDYQTLAATKVLTTQGIQIAQALCDNKTHESSYIESLLAQAKANFDNAVAAADAAEVTLKKAQRKATMTEIDFRVKGIPAWQQQQILNAVIDLATAIISFGVGIATSLAGDKGGDATGAAINTTQAVQQAASTGSDLANLAQKLGEVMKQLEGVIEALKKVYELTKAVVAAATNIHDAQQYMDQMKDLDVTGGANITATYEWQVFQVNAAAVLADPVALGIPYAVDLQVAVDEVAIYGQQLNAAQVAVVKAGQDYSTLLLQKELATAEQGRLEELVASLKVGEAPLTEMMQRFYQRYLDAKSSLFCAAQGYRASYFYWALQPSNIHPRIIDPVDALDTGLGQLTAITLDKANALMHFSPPPQTLVDAQIVIDDPEVLDALRRDHRATFTIDLDTPAFEGFDRVRLTTVRAWIEGARPHQGASVNVGLHTAGSYLDRFRKTKYQFTSKPLSRAFRYRVGAGQGTPPDWAFGDGTYGHVEVDGSVDKEVSYAYFEPTPFAEWTIQVSKDVNVSNVARVTLQLAGSLIPAWLGARVQPIRASLRWRSRSSKGRSKLVHRA